MTRKLICVYRDGEIGAGWPFIMTDLGIAHYFKTQCINYHQDAVLGPQEPPKAEEC